MSSLLRFQVRIDTSRQTIRQVNGLLLLECSKTLKRDVENGEEMNKQSKSTEIYARIYIHGASIGKQTECEIAYRNIRVFVYKLYDKRQIEGARLFIIEHDTHAEYRFLNILFDYSKITKNVFPFTYAEIQPMPQMNVDLDEQVESLGFKRYQ